MLLCGRCHNAHDNNYALIGELHRIAQRAFEEHYKGGEDPREYFRREFGLSFL